MRFLQIVKKIIPVISPIVYLLLFLLLTCIIGDYLLYNIENSFVKAVSDNITHGLVGFWTWLIIIYNVQCSFNSNFKLNWKSLLAALLISSIIDSDHFIQAHSLQLKVNFIYLILSSHQQNYFISFSGCCGTNRETISSLLSSSCYISGLLSSHRSCV